MHARAELRHAVAQARGAAAQRLGADGGFGRAAAELVGCRVQLRGSLAQALYAVLGARRVEQDQAPALLVEALIDLVPEFGGKHLGNARTFKTIALGRIHHQLARAGLGAGHGVGAEVGWNDERKGQRAVAHLLARVVCGVYAVVAKAGALLKLRHQLLAHVDGLFAVNHASVLVDQAHLQRAAVGSRVPNAGEVNYHVQRRNKRHRQHRQQRFGAAYKVGRL